MALKDLTNLKFGRLMVLERGPNTAHGRATWLCSCVCGVTKNIKSENLTRTRGATESCGCIQSETRKLNGEKVGRLQQHEYSGSEYPREKSTWRAMLARCYDTSDRGYANYGGRGICVCDDWRYSFKAFVHDMGRRPIETTLERIDNNLGYFKANCRWATKMEQANNRRTNRRITVNGVTQTVAQWARELGISCHVIHTRIYTGMDEVEAVRKSIRHFD